MRTTVKKRWRKGKWCDVRGSRITREKEDKGEKKMTRWRLSAEGTSNNL